MGRRGLRYLWPMKQWLFFALLGLLLPNWPVRGQAQDFLVRLAPEKLALPAGPWRVVRVLDARADHRLGQVRVGLENRLVPAAFAQPLAAEVLAFIQANTPPQPAARPVVLRILTLAVGEDLRATSETGEAELIADFLEPQPDSTYRVLLPVGEYLRRGGLDVTGHHAANVATQLQAGLQQLAALPLAAPAGETLSRAAAAAGQGGAAAQRYPVQTQPAPRGLYHHFAEFRNHAPAPDARVYEVKYPARPNERQQLTGEVRANYIDRTADYPREPIRDVWGLNDGQQDYISHSGIFYPLRPAADGHSYTFLAPPPYNPQKAGTMAAAAVAGGLAGAAIAGALQANGPPAVTYELRLATGRVTTAEDFQPTAQADTAVVWVYCRPNKAQQEDYNVLLDGKLAGVLYAQSGLRLTWLRTTEEPLCVQQRPAGPAAPVCLPFHPDFR